jgi:hypothetical protein
MSRLSLAGVLALALLLPAAGCGSDDGDGAKQSSAARDETAASQTAAPRLDAEEQHALDKVRADFTAYCKNKGAAPVGSAALAESLLDFGPDVQTTGGSTLGADLTRSRDELRACGAKALAKRLDAALR